MRLKFYLNLAGIVLFSIAVGVVFEYMAWLAWQMKLGMINVRYEAFAAMAIILLIMFIADIILFFRLILRREYW